MKRLTKSERLIRSGLLEHISKFGARIEFVERSRHKGFIIYWRQHKRKFVFNHHTNAPEEYIKDKIREIDSVFRNLNQKTENENEKAVNYLIVAMHYQVLTRVPQEKRYAFRHPIMCKKYIPALPIL